ncbi:hypothetical protein SAMN05421819_2534 [Bryocella elongata]|uniref:Uncharacterized protein n=1 Tax=Bryocella elongata TaxID=863522 RepID=A0A1H5ZAD2_9BACT|nr:hypothetical protein SAMN05421819_2534 [Bryocella elongata]
MWIGRDSWFAFGSKSWAHIVYLGSCSLYEPTKHAFLLEGEERWKTRLMQQNYS